MTTERYPYFAVLAVVMGNCLLMGCPSRDGDTGTNNVRHDAIVSRNVPSDVLSMPLPPSLTLEGHSLSYGVYAVVFSPEGKRLAVGSGDLAVNVWDLGTGQQVLALKGHTKLVTSVAFSSDGQRLASASEDHTAKLWDALTGEELHTLNGHSEWVSSVAFSRDGRRLVSGSTDFTAKVWDVAGGHELLTLKGHTHYVQRIVFSSDGTRLASASADQTVKLWDADTGEELRTLNGHSSTVIDVAFSPDGNRLVSSSVDGAVKIWDVATGEELRALNGFGAIFSLDGQRLATMSFETIEVDSRKGVDGKAQLRETTHIFWDVATGEELFALKRGIGRWYLSPDWKWLARVHWGGKLELWEVTQP